MLRNMPETVPTRTTCCTPGAAALPSSVVGTIARTCGEPPGSAVTVHVLPPSVVLNTPIAGPPVCPRLLDEPVPAKSVLPLASNGLNSMSCIESVVKLSVSANHAGCSLASSTPLAPSSSTPLNGRFAFVERQMPPFTVLMRTCAGLAGSIAMSSTAPDAGLFGSETVEPLSIGLEPRSPQLGMPTRPTDSSVRNSSGSISRTARRAASVIGRW